ncbi:thioredoxin [Desulfitibacter alkalitolerans]|uniref:thioredoxin n=1 Tax=Desulfitibacter alkalitolerans TaxID=264641 RepID=UPI000483870E|nr:thioredoxin [Desulfitibacter alkalitolerans]
MASDKIIKIEDNNFESAVLNSKETVLVDFWAAWCGPCRMIAPVIDEIAEELAGIIKVGKLNVDENPQTPTQFGVMSIPTLIIFKGGEEVERIVGFKTKNELSALLKKYA